MPNWCSNTVSVSGPKVDVEKFLEAVGGDERFPHFNFNGVVPMPEELVGTESPNRNEELAAKFTEKYGASDWYNWALKNWGTKWNCTGVDDWDVTHCKNNEIIATINVDTAWSPPTEFLIKASEIYPSLIFENRYFEGGNCYIGSHVILKGYFESKLEPDWDSEEGIEMRKEFGIYDEDQEND